MRVQNEQIIKQILLDAKEIYKANDEETYCVYQLNQGEQIFFKTRKMMKIQSNQFELVRRVASSCIGELNQEMLRTQSRVSSHVLVYDQLIISYPDAILIHQPIFNVLPNLAHTKLTYDARIGLMMGIAIAVQDLHRKSICIRNLQPAQIVILSVHQNKYEIVFSNIKNFVVITEKNVQTKLQQINSYTAPEIIQKKPYNFSCDIWSLGAIFYEIFFNIEFNNPKYSQIRYPKDYPLWIAKFLEKMLSRKPQDRQRIGDVIKIFEKAQFCAPEARKYYKV